MAKDKNSTTDGSGASNNPQDHGAVIFNPDGSVQRRELGQTVGPHAHQEAPHKEPGLAQQTVDTSESRTPKSPPPIHGAGLGKAEAVAPDMNPVLMERIRDEAARSAEQHADDLAEAMYTKFMSLLTDTMTEKGGTLSMDDVAEMGEAFRNQMGEIKETFLSAVESYTQAREETRVNSERGKVFHRVMVHQFENRFVNEKTLKEKPDYLSRRMLPGFYNAFSMMFGPPKLERYERQANMVLDRLRKETNGQLEWHDVYITPEARRISLRAQIDIARHFKDVDKRLDWLIAMVNSNMIPLEDGRISSGWSFGREAAEALLHELFHDLRTALHSEATRQKFADELGGETVKILDNVMKRFA